jgi:short-subunit dehydrogenase
MIIKTIFITGCSTGIGYALAIGLKAKGHRVFATARKEADVQKLKQLGFEAYLLDLENSNSIQKCVKEILALTQIDVLIHNGAYGQVGALEDISREVLKKQFETNVFGWHELTNLLLPTMKKQDYGRIIYLSSVLGFIAMPFRGSYNASKFAIEGLVDTLRLELRQTKVQLSLIEPGPIRSKFRENAYIQFMKNVDMNNSAYKNNYEQMIKRLNSPKEAKWTLPETAVLDCVIDAIERKNAKIRYRVTFPTKLFSFLVRILPTTWMDNILYKAGGGGSR